MTDLETGPSSIRDDSICESSLHPNKSSGDIVERTWTPEQFWEFTEGRDGEFSAQQLRDVMEDVGLVIVPAAEIERLRREVGDWKQAASVEAGLRREFLKRAEAAESALAAAWEEAAKICDQVRNNAERRAAQHENGEARNSALDKMEGAIQCASAIRAAVSKAESGHSPSTHNSESE